MCLKVREYLKDFKYFSVSNWNVRSGKLRRWRGKYGLVNEGFYMLVEIFFEGNEKIIKSIKYRRDII